MPIPKIIFQTWKTRHLPPEVEALRQKIATMNPGYTMMLYDDTDIDIFIKTHFDNRVYSNFRKLNVGAAKADFWRYCALYVCGGVYLDMDSEITRPLDELIEAGDHCIITRESNPYIFNNWMMVFEKGHPIMKATIDRCCYNIENQVSNDICYLTGPSGPYTDAIHDVMLPMYSKKQHLYFESDENLNAELNNRNNSVRCRFYKVDWGEYAKWKSSAANYLYEGCKHWREENQIYK